MEDIRGWYDGYIFGIDTSVYNPWSIINYLSCPENGFRHYWVNTSNNRIIKEVIQLDKKEGKEVIAKLIKGEEVRKVIEENILKEWFEDEVKLSLDIKALISALEESNEEKFQDSMQYIYLKYVSYNDIKVENLRYAEQEERQVNFHHGFMLGFMIYAEAKCEIYRTKPSTRIINLRGSNQLDIDVAEAIADKSIKNAIKYPEDKDNKLN